jgi:hypothetical protein
MDQLRPVDIDVGKRRTWSIEGVTVPLTLVGGLLLQTAFFAFWLSGLSSDVKTLTKNQDKADVLVYKQSDATKDLAVRDQRLTDLERRVRDLEQIADGRKH